MGSSENDRHHPDDDQVDFEADTKESTEEVFYTKDTVESPHKVTCWYPQDLSQKIVKHFPSRTLRCQVGEELMFGRNRTADVLLNEEHMAREFATITIRNKSNAVGVFMRNVSRQKRIIITDKNGRKKELRPTQETELFEKTLFRLECVEFEIGIDLGDTEAKIFELDVKPVRTDSADANGPGGIAGSPRVLTSVTDLESPHVGLPVAANHRASPINQRDPIAGQQCYDGYGRVIPVAGVPYQQTHYVPPPPQYHQAPYVTSNPLVNYGYPDQPASVFSQPSAMHPSNMMYHNQQNLPGSHPQLLERGGGAWGGYYPPGQSWQYPVDASHSHGLNMSALSQTLPKLQETVTQPGRGIVTNPSTQDERPVLYPNPGSQRFRFPEPQSTSHAPLSPDLTNLPRGPPLSRLSSPRSVDLHPPIPVNMVTTHPVTETGEQRDSKDLKSKCPIEHEDKPK